MSARADELVSGPGLVDVLSLERIEADLFRSRVVYDDPFGLYGGQVAAQALHAAALTVDPDRQPHSLHGYFLSRGDPSRRVLLMVNRDRDGRSYSNRQVIAVQNGVVIFNMAASFHVTEDGPGYQAHPMPLVAAPEDAPALAGPDQDARDRDQGVGAAGPRSGNGRRGCGCGLLSTWPARRCTRAPSPISLTRVRRLPHNGRSAG